jgi:hypothetical protein
MGARDSMERIAGISRHTGGLPVQPASSSWLDHRNVIYSVINEQMNLEFEI